MEFSHHRTDVLFPRVDDLAVEFAGCGVQGFLFDPADRLGNQASFRAIKEVGAWLNFMPPTA